MRAGDTVIFSSRTIPGNEKAVGKLINAFLAGGVEVITDRNALVHVSGHPRRAELARMYDWLRPKIAVPAHGEALHLSEHAAFARAQGVPQVLRAFNGDLVRFAPGDVATIGKIGGGRRMKDGEILLPAEQDCIAQRRRLSFAGVVSIAIALTPNGEMAGDPDVMIAGLPERTRDGAGFDGIIDGAIFDTFEGPAARQAARPGILVERDRARGAQFGQQRLGQEAAGACAGGRGVAAGVAPFPGAKCVFSTGCGASCVRARDRCRRESREPAGRTTRRSGRGSSASAHGLVDISGCGINHFKLLSQHFRPTERR